MNTQDVIVKAGDIYQSQELYNRLNAGKVGSATYALYFALNVAELNKQYAEIEAKRVELIVRYGEEKDGQTTVTEDNLGAFNEEFIELMSAEVAVDLYLFDPEKLDIMFRELVEDGGLTGEDVFKIKYMVAYD